MSRLSYTPNIACSISTKSGSVINIDDCFLEYLDLISSLLGIEINYEEFSKLDEGERKSFLRELKINKILK